MNKQEWRFLIIFIIIFSIIGLFYFGRKIYITKNEEEYVPQYLKDAEKGKQQLVSPKVYGVNEYSIINMKESEMAPIYLRDFYNLMITDINQAYGLLEDEFRQEHYPTIQSFQLFVDRVKADTNSLNIATKTVSSSQNTYIYDIITKSGVNYFFTAEGIMVYRVRFNNK